MSNASYGFLSGGGPASAKFNSHGDTVGGEIIAEPVQQQMRDLKTNEPQTWPDGNPKMQLVVTVQTDLFDPEVQDDDGKRRIFVKGQMRNAVQKAVIAAGAQGLDVGGSLHVTYVGDGEKKGNLTAPKLYSAVYTKPTAAAAPATPQAVGATGGGVEMTPELAAALAQLQGNK